MFFVNFAASEVSCKLVYCGAHGSGKQTSLQYIYRHAAPGTAGAWNALGAPDDPSISCDLLPAWLPRQGGLRVRLHCYLQPGPAQGEANRRLVLRGLDGVCFVADSNPSRRLENLRALEMLGADLVSLGYDPRGVPLVFQYNKRDLPGAVTRAELSALLNSSARPEFETIAKTGHGVQAALQALAREALARHFGAATQKEP